MALRDQPYLPLYVQDVLTDEKLIDCSAEAHGVYFRLLCIFHKQEVYGEICLKQKYKQNTNQIENFALLLSKQMPFSKEQISKSLEELISEKVITLEGDFLFQKRMKKDGELSLMRAGVGKKGGSNVTKQYGKSGYLYLMSDGYEKNKIGISVDPKNRLYRLRSDLKLPKHFVIKEQINVLNMGESEDFAQEYFKDILDGEWLIDSYINVKKRFDLLKAKIQANDKANTVNENEYVIENSFTNSSNNTNGENSKKIEPLTFQDCIERMKTDEKLKEDQVFINKISLSDYLEYLEIFARTKKTVNERERVDYSDKRQHFINWTGKYKDTFEKNRGKNLPQQEQRPKAKLL